MTLKIYKLWERSLWLLPLYVMGPTPLAALPTPLAALHRPYAFLILRAEARR
jgi:hypothetical protein